MRDTEIEAETQAEGEAGFPQGPLCGTRSQDSRITPWAKGRCQTAEPPRDPLNLHFYFFQEFYKNQVVQYIVIFIFLLPSV